MSTVNMSSLGLSGISTGIDTKALVSAILTTDIKKLSSLQNKQKAAQAQIDNFETLDDYTASTQSLLYTASRETDRTAFIKDIQAFVDSYNTQLKNDQKDPEAVAVLKKVKQATFSINDDYMVNYGVSTNRDGSLSFNESKATAAIASDPDFQKAKATMASFAGTSSFSEIDSYIHGKIIRANDQVNRLDTQINREQAIIDRKTSQLTLALAQMEAYTANNANSQSTLFKINTNA